jgi:Tol biopolymer transport system component
MLPVETRNIALDWSRDGRFNLYRTNDPPDNEWSIWAVAADGRGKPFAVLNSSFDERSAVFSPDSKWIAYESNESGQYEIYVHPFPGPGDKWTVSSGGGSQPRWKRDGTELFYVAADGHLMSVPVRLPAPGQRLHLGTPARLFRTAIESTVQGGISYAYDVSADGQRFLMSVVVEQPPSFLTLILNRSAR